MDLTENLPKIELEGYHGKATVYSSELDNQCRGYIQKLLDSPLAENSNIAFMSDIHPGKGCCIGLTMTIGDYIAPAMLGVDIGCGVTTYRYPKTKKTARINLNDFDKAVKRVLNKDTTSNTAAIAAFDSIEYFLLNEPTYDPINLDPNYLKDKALNQFGTIGGGNHFIELEEDEEFFYITVHSGSRGLGGTIAKKWMDYAYEESKSYGDPYELARICEEDRIAYINHVSKLSEWASRNRSFIINHIAKDMKWHVCDESIEWTMDAVHNGIDYSYNAGYILHKGANCTIRNDGLKIPIPINGKEGLLIGTACTDYAEKVNFGLPHGTGRKYARSDVANYITFNSVKKDLEGVYVSNLDKKLLDEAPGAYYSLDRILPYVSQFMSDIKVVKPIYSFKNLG